MYCEDHAVPVRAVHNAASTMLPDAKERVTAFIGSIDESLLLQE